MTHDPAHASGVRRLLRQLRIVENSGYLLHSQLPVTLASAQEPEPDLAIVRGREEDYQLRHPGPQDIAAIMEVADSSLTFDRTTKLRLYAGANIPTYWIVNLVDYQVEVYRDPQAAQSLYVSHTDYRAGQALTLKLGAGPDFTIAVTELLPNR